MAEFIAVPEEGELQVGAMRAVDVDGFRVLLSRSEDGGVCAIANACTHVGGPPDEGERDGNVVSCPWHGSRFDLCSGEVLRGPAREPQRRFEARLREGKVEVRSQRPKLERYDGGTLFVVLRPARYVDETETVEFGEVHVFMGEDFAVTVRHGEASELGNVRNRLEGDRGLLRLGAQANLYAVMDRIVDDYASVVAGLENDIDAIETEVFSDNADVSLRIYKLSREVIQFQGAAEPLPELLKYLISHAGDPDLQMYMRDVQDHTLHTTEQLRGFRELLKNFLSVNSALVGICQNEEVKGLTQAGIAQADEVKMISAWAAILFAPTLVGAVYGMNFDHMPELRWTLGYTFALALMVVVSASLYLAFERRG